MFVQTDEVLRSQLDRKARLNDLSNRNVQDNTRLRARVEMARSISRSRSPVYERQRSPVYERQTSLVYERQRSPVYERSVSPPLYERTRSPVYEKKYGGGDPLRSPTKGDLRTTAATKKYGADFDEE